MMHVRFKKRYWKAHRLILRQAHCNIFPSCPYWILISVHPQSKKKIIISQSTLDLRAKTNLSFEVWWGRCDRHVASIPALWLPQYLSRKLEKSLVAVRAIQVYGDKNRVLCLIWPPIQIHQLLWLYLHKSRDKCMNMSNTFWESNLTSMVYSSWQMENMREWWVIIVYHKL